MRKIVVFGATGTLGAQITLWLHNNGYRIYAVGHRKNDNGFFSDYDIPYYYGDIESKELFEKLPQNDIYAVLHFAGALPAQMKGYDPMPYIDSIIKGTLNVLEYTRKCGAEKIVFPQSLFDISYLFGTKVPISADAEKKAPLDGDHAMYVIAKIAAVNIIEHYHVVYGLKRFILRLPRIYMYHPNPFTFTDGAKVLISDRYLIKRALKSEDIEIWGDPDRLLETVCVKDFLQIVQKCLEVNSDGGIYNVASGGSTLEERVKAIVDVFCPVEKKSKIIYYPNKKNCTQFVLDYAKTSDELGYIPKYDWKKYLLDFKKDMETQPFAKLLGTEDDYI